MDVWGSRVFTVRFEPQPGFVAQAVPAAMAPGRANGTSWSSRRGLGVWALPSGGAHSSRASLRVASTEVFLDDQHQRRQCSGAMRIVVVGCLLHSRASAGRAPAPQKLTSIF